MPPIISLEPSQRLNSRAMGMAVRDLETKLVRHAAPTLAGMKPANLFTYRTANFTEEEASSAIAEISSRLAGFHLRVEPLGKPRSRRFAFGIPPRTRRERFGQ